MPSFVPAKRATEYIFFVSLVSQADTKLFQNNPTIAAGDFLVSTDGGATTNLDTLPVVTPASSDSVKVTVSVAEMTGDNIKIVASDAAGAEWCDQSWNIQTAVRQIDDLAFPATSGRSFVVETDGMIHGDLKEWLGVAPDALTGGKLATIGLIEVATAQSATATNLRLVAGATAHVGDVLHIISATTGAKESRFITAFNDTTKDATVDTWDTTPTGTIVYAQFAVPQGASTGVTVGSMNPDVMDNVAQATSAVNEIRDAILAAIIEGTVTLKQSLALTNAASAGKLSGGATTSNKLRNLADTLDRITATVDSDGNRTAITTVFTDL